MKEPMVTGEIKNPFKVSARDRQESILQLYSPEQRQVILERQGVLSTLAYFIGKDFSIPVELNEPRQGWHWDFEHNVIRIDPQDLLEKSMDYLRFVICHEGGHRRISRTGFIPKDVWSQPGFSFMMNAIEDPRDNNFVAQCYPKYGELMRAAYLEDIDFEAKAKEKAQEKLGRQPRFMKAGFEYIKLWLRDIDEKEPELSSDLGDEVSEVVLATIEAAKDSWYRYPTREEANESEDHILAYARRSYEINKNEVWPYFKKLVERDLEDQAMAEFIKSLGAQPKNEDLAAAKKRFDELSDAEKTALREQARQLIEAFEQELNQEIEGKLGESNDAEVIATLPQTPLDDAEKNQKNRQPPGTKAQEEDLVKKMREKIARLVDSRGDRYQEARQEILPLADKLETDLREIFVNRHKAAWESGRAKGKRIDMQKRIQEKVKSVSVMESRAWQTRELPTEKDYAISLLVDLSGSMGMDNKIVETFKAVVLLAEVLNRLSIKLEILGFNEGFYEYQSFGENLSPQIREKMGTMPSEVDTQAAGHNNDGWAILQATGRMAKLKTKEKFLIVLSDGMPAPSYEFSMPEYELSGVIKKIANEGTIKMVGLGVGKDTKHVEQYYPNSIADVGVEKMSTELARLLKRVIEGSDTFQ